MQKKQLIVMQKELNFARQMKKTTNCQILLQDIEEPTPKQLVHPGPQTTYIKPP